MVKAVFEGVSSGADEVLNILKEQVVAENIEPQKGQDRKDIQAALLQSIIGGYKPEAGATLGSGKTLSAMYADLFWACQDINYITKNLDIPSGKKISVLTNVLGAMSNYWSQQDNGNTLAGETLSARQARIEMMVDRINQASERSPQQAPLAPRR